EIFTQVMQKEKC
ncbi:Peptidase T, partial [Haemophilus influenzae]